MNLLEVQIIDKSAWVPSKAQFQCWIDNALSESSQETDTEIVIRVVDEQEISMLNEQYRHKKGPTNILSFPFESPAGFEFDLLGDLVICAAVVAVEATRDHKPLEAHWAHIVIHGVLHLLGFDHLQDKQAEIMEAQEISILQKLKINNPYLETDK